MGEILLMTGFSFVGVLFTDPSSWANPSIFLPLLLYVAFYVMAVYFLNSYADYAADMLSERLKNVSKLSRSKYLGLLVLACMAFSALSYYISYILLAICWLGMLLWFFYYVPPFRFKATLFGGSIIHFIAGIVHFQMGYCSYQPFSSNSLLISIFFATLLCIGHLHHEIIDVENDTLAGYQTTAVRIGVKRMLQLRTATIAIATIYLSVLLAMGIIEAMDFNLLLLPTLILLVNSILLKGNKHQTLLFQYISRGVFLLFCFLLLVIKWLAS
ncbi:MAG: UbiA family prenyltransferase [Chitinophagales bacterium]|nr:UbiA family prenyltransferase [Chitinophagales bacterium]